MTLEISSRTRVADSKHHYTEHPQLLKCFLDQSGGSDGALLVPRKELRGRLAALAGGTGGSRLILVLVEINGDTILSRLLSWSSAVFTLPFLRRRLDYSGFSVTGYYGVYPDLASPRIVYSLNDEAARYASRCLLPDPAYGVQARVRSALSALTGCPTSLGAIVIVAHRS